MSTSLKHNSKLVMQCALLCASLLSVPVLVKPAMAAELPEYEQVVAIAAREQPVQRFFEELFGQIGVAVKVDPGVTGSINGDFRGSAKSIYQKIARSFQLTLYYDGTMAYIYPAADVSRNIMQLPDAVARRVVANAEKMNLGDKANHLTMTDMGLVVTGTDRFNSQIKDIANALQKRTKTDYSPEHVFRVFKLKYAWADDVVLNVGGQEMYVPGVATTMRQLLEPGGNAGVYQGGIQQIQKPRTEEGLRGKGLQSVGFEQKLQPAGTVNKETSARPVSPKRVASADQAGSGDDARIVAEPLTNSVIIRDRADQMPMYENLIAILDIEPQMIEIEATIIDMDTDRLRTLGVNWRYERDGNSALFGQGNIQDSFLFPAAEVDPTTASQGGILSLVLGSQDEFISRIRALETQGAARIVSKPHLMTLSNVEALLSKKDNLFVRIEGQEEVDLFNLQVGTELRVTPHVFRDNGVDQIKLRVNISDGNQSSQQVDGIPVLEESLITTQALINIGESLLIGGLAREYRQNGVSKVPVLGDIPGLGALFRNNSKSSSRVERMFLITPRLNIRNTGPVYNQPVLAGDATDIIESGPSRMEPTFAALAARDVAYPIKEELPKGQADAELISADQPLPSPRRNSGTRTFQPIQPSLRQQVGREPADNTLEPAPGPATQVVQQSPDAGWQQVTTTNEVSARVPNTVPVPVPEADNYVPVVSTSESLFPVDEDSGWQPVRTQTDNQHGRVLQK